MTRYKPVSDNAKSFAKFSGKRTFDLIALNIIRELGFDIVLEAPALPDDENRQHFLH